MGLNAGEQRALSCIADELAVSDHGLASILAEFNSLTSGEEMPARQGRRRVTAWHVVTGWVLLSVAALAVAIVLAHIGPGADGRGTCTQSWSAGHLFPTVTCRTPARAVHQRGL